MSISKSPTSAIPPRSASTRERVLDAAERLLRSGSAEFSMRELAAEAGVSFATPFNQFGSKVAIMHALSARRIDAMARRYDETKQAGDAVARVLLAVDIASAVMLAEPEINRAVMGMLGAAGGEPGRVMAESRALWSLAIAEGDGLAPDVADVARAILPRHLAMAFRGVLSFWTAGEIADADLGRSARDAAAVSLLGFLGGTRRAVLLARLRAS